jgi:hypothetical protein
MTTSSFPRERDQDREIKRERSRERDQEREIKREREQEQKENQKIYFALPNRLFFFMLASVKKSIFFTLKLLFFTLELLFFHARLIFFALEAAAHKKVIPA